MDTSMLHLDAMIAAGYRGRLHEGYIRKSGWPTVHPNTRDHERRFREHDHRVAINYGDSWRSLTQWRVSRYADFAHPTSVY